MMFHCLLFPCCLHKGLQKCHGKLHGEHKISERRIRENRAV